ncbi:MAG TPA: hypothetical protein VM074_10710 [Solimonas sp.]|nr:hypothetical protein [Solimonas sp.]
MNRFRRKSGLAGLTVTLLASACQSAPPAPPAASATSPEGCTIDFPADAPLLALAATEAPAQTDDRKGQPLRFATSIAVHRQLEDAGAWGEFSDGWSSLYLRVASPGAKSLSLHLAQLSLPARAQVWFCSADNRVRQGPYREAVSGELWTPVVPGSEARIEVQVPTAAKRELRAQLAEVFGAYR